MRRVRRTLDEAELGDWVDRLCQIGGEDRLARYRAQAEQFADAVGAPSSGIQSLLRMIGAALGTQQTATRSKALTARQARLPYDHDRLSRFDRLITALRASAPQNRPVTDAHDARYRHLPFFEAYFSNIIEGTEFEIRVRRAPDTATSTVPTAFLARSASSAWPPLSTSSVDVAARLRRLSVR